MSAGSHEGAFHRWLLKTQIEPVFGWHAFVMRAHVLVIPQPWALPTVRKATRLMIFYSASEVLDLDGAVDAMASGGRDPNLPEGVCNHDLFQPIDWAEPRQGEGPPLALCPRELFRGWARDAERGCHEGLDAFASYGHFDRDADGAVVCRRYDAQLSALIDHVM